MEPLTSSGGGTQGADFNRGGFPVILLANDLLEVEVLTVDKENGYYRACRFDWSGFMAQVTCQGHTFFREWRGYDGTLNPGIHDPMNIGSATGIAEEFRFPLGYEAASVGGGFVKVGVGVLRKSTDADYFFANHYTIIDTGVWNVSSGKDWVLFEHTLNTDFGYAYHYTKKIYLVEGKAEINVLHSLRNTGEKDIVTSTYCHNFFRFDNEFINPNYLLQFPQDITPLADFTGKAEIKGKTFRLLKTLEDRVPVCGDLWVGRVNEFSLSNEKTKTAVHVKGSHPLSPVKNASFYVYIGRLAHCPEPMIDLDIKPGETTEWNNNYRFEV